MTDDSKLKLRPLPKTRAELLEWLQRDRAEMAKRRSEAAKRAAVTRKARAVERQRNEEN